MLLINALAKAQITTSNIEGYVNSGQDPLISATVIATHTPSGTVYGTATKNDGSFVIANIRVGGPYTIKVSYVGYEDYSISNIYAGLDQNAFLKIDLKEVVDTSSEVVVTSASFIDGYKMGTENIISDRDIINMPTVDRSLNDFLRTVPQASISPDGAGISFAGMNNRYNSIFIDGAVNNDVFGLAASGTNGGQTGVNPISIDAIEQIQVSLAPYDVRLGGFAGGGISAVTRSGTNRFEGSTYLFYKNQGLVGLTPTFQLPDTIERERLPDFTASTYGLRLGGPIIKDKLFFFVNAEIQREITPQPFSLNDYLGNSTQSDLDALINKLQDFGYDPGTFDNNADELNSEKFIFKLDYNLNQNNKLSLRHSYVNGRQLNLSSSLPNVINFSNNGIYFPSTTHSTAFEWNATFGNKFSNNLIAGFTHVNDDRDPNGKDFSRVVINDGNGSIVFGSEEFSTANQLVQNVFTLTDNFNMYLGKHTITLGTHNEFYNMYNLFIRQNYGSYRFASLNDFLNDSISIDYDRSYSLVDNVTGDGSDAAARFNAMQLGLYAQDKFAIRRNFTLTYGVRLDLPMFLSQPATDTFFNNNVVPVIDTVWNLQGATSGRMPKTQLMVSPRIGFNFDVNGDRKTIIRGGIGLFTSRVPFVWPAGSFTNNGLTVGGVSNQRINFIADPQQQLTATDFGLTDPVPSGEMNIITPNFKYPQVLRTTLGFDQKLPLGLTLTVEGIYTKFLNNIYYQNVNLRAPIDTLQGTPDNRNYYNGRISSTYTDIILLSNTNKGSSYNATIQLTKDLVKGFSGTVAYTYSDATSIFEGTSSQNSSQWRGALGVDGRNFAELGRSDFSTGSRVFSGLNYSISYGKKVSGRSTLSIFYNGQSGQAYSYIYDNGSFSRGPNNEDSRERVLIYIPENQSDIILVDKGTRTAAQQWTELEAFINNDPYLSNNKGQYAEKNKNRTPFTNIIDLRFLQDITYTSKKGDKNTLQFSLDIFNFTNLLNKNWGRSYVVNSSNFNNYELLRFEGFQTGTKVPTYSFPEQKGAVWTESDFQSRWRIQLGLRYIFNR